LKKLERRLTLPYVVAIAIGGMLGSGIFVLPGLAAAKTGPSVWMAYILAGICVLPAALSQSELATAMPASGGSYVFIERCFGPMMGTIAGFGLWLSLLLKSSFALIGFGAYLLVLTNFPLKIAALVMLSIILLLNIFGVRKVGKVQIVVVSISLVGMILLLLFGLVSVEQANLEPFFTKGGKGFLAATGFVFVSYAGVTKVAAIAGEIKNPGRNLPMSMIFALLAIGSIYGFVVFTLVGNIPVDILEQDYHPIFTLAVHMGGKIAGIVAALLGVLTLSSMANSGVLAASRFPFAMSRDNLLPQNLKKVHHRFLTPVTTILLTGGVMFLVIIFLDVERIAKLASAFMVMMFIAVNASVIVLRETAVQWYKPEYRSPWYPGIQVFGIISGLILLGVLGGLVLSGGLTITILGLIVFYFYGRKNAQRSGVLKQYGHLPAMFLLYRRSRKKMKERRKNQSPFPELKEAGTAQIYNQNLDGSLADESAVVIPLFGEERSAEMLVEVGAALANGSKVQVVHLTEVPDQTLLDAMLEEDAAVTSLNRRISAMAEEKKVDVDFDAAVTHELVQTVQDISNQTHCRWLVVSWDGRAGRGLLIRNPIGWLVTHISCNLALFKDKGIRYIRKILVLLDSPQNDHWVVIAADWLACFYNAELTLVRVEMEEKAKDDTRKFISYMEDLCARCKAPSQNLLLFHKDPFTAITDASAGFDLLITGSPKEESLFNILLGTSKDRLSDLAACSVLRLTKPHSYLFRLKGGNH